MTSGASTGRPYYAEAAYRSAVAHPFHVSAWTVASSPNVARSPTRRYRGSNGRAMTSLAEKEVGEVLELHDRAAQAMACWLETRP